MFDKLKARARRGAETSAMDAPSTLTAVDRSTVATPNDALPPAAAPQTGVVDDAIVAPEPTVAPGGPTILRTSDEVAQFVETANQLLSSDYAAFIDMANATVFEFHPAETDPHSDAYRREQLERYLLISGRSSYELASEGDPSVDASWTPDRWFPNCTQDLATVGDYFVGVGTILRNLSLPPRSRIVEFGPGWGHSTILLALSGCDVTAVDIEPKYLQLIERRAIDMNVAERITTVNSSFVEFAERDGQYDGAVFFECFHHCLDHAQLIAALADRIRPGGRIMLAREAIYDEDYPMPWGLRPDGHAIWAVRNYGLGSELGFRESYLRDAFELAGFDFAKVQGSNAPGGATFVATRR